jgi:hypothetical protein
MFSMTSRRMPGLVCRQLSGRRASRERRRDLDGRGNCRRGALLDRCGARRSRGSAGFVVADVRQGPFEFPDPLAERLADLRKPLRAEDEQGDEQNEEDFAG